MQRNVGPGYGRTDVTAFALALVVAGPAVAPPTDPSALLAAQHRQATAVRVLRPPRIDGRLDDAAWQNVPVLSDFVQRVPDEGRPASEPTEVRIAYDDRAIYLAFRCYDSHASEIEPRLGRRDDAPESDWVEFAVDPFHDRRNSYFFLVNSGGVKTDGTLADGGTEDYSWDGVWDAQTSIDARGWTAEIEIPLSTILEGIARHANCHPDWLAVSRV